jgi:hypothetical protein
MNYLDNIDNDNRIYQRYLHNIDNVIKIYVRFCEFLETMPNDEKHEFIERMHEMYDTQIFIESYDVVLSYRDNQRVDENQWMFGNFLQDYITENPELNKHRDEIMNMDFTPDLFQEGFEIFNNCAICLK